MLIKIAKGKILKQKRENYKKLFNKMFEFWKDFFITEEGYLPTDKQIKEVTKRSIAQAIFDGRVNAFYQVKTA